MRCIVQSRPGGGMSCVALELRGWAGEGQGFTDYLEIWQSANMTWGSHPAGQTFSLQVSWAHLMFSLDMAWLEHKLDVDVHIVK